MFGNVTNDTAQQLAQSQAQLSAQTDLLYWLFVVSVGMLLLFFVVRHVRDSLLRATPRMFATSSPPAATVNVSLYRAMYRESMTLNNSRPLTPKDGVRSCLYCGIAEQTTAGTCAHCGAPYRGVAT